MKSKYFVFFVVFISFFTFQSIAHAGQWRENKTILDNGMTVLVTEMPNNPVVSLYTFVKTGSALEDKFLGSGITHFVEHMIFKGTEKYGVGEIAAKIQALGGSINASTSRDFTMFTITVPVEAFDEALDILADMMQTAKMDAEEVEKERTVILNEMRMLNDRADRYFSTLTFRIFYTQHPYRNPIIGYEGLFKKITADNLKEYYQTHYSPNNMICSIAGAVNYEEVLPKIEAAFGKFERKRDVLRILPTEPQQITERYYEDEYPTDLTRLSVSFQSVSLLDDDLFALDVLANILGQGASSRLYRDLYKDKQLVRGISVSNFTPVDKGAFEIEAMVDEENVEIVVEEILQHIEDVKQNGVLEKELEKVKQQMIADEVFSQQQTGHIAYMQAYYEAYAGGYQFGKKYLAQIEKVTVQDVQRVANQYLKMNKKTVVALRPKKEEIAIEAKQAIVQKEVKRIVLDNGAVLILKEDTSLPLISIHAVFRGGVREETLENNGIFQLMASSLVKRTKDLTSEELSEFVESKGIRLGSFSGNNSFGVNIESLSKDFDDVWSLFVGFLNSPVFGQDEINLVKKGLLTQIQAQQESISILTGKRLRQLLYPNHPYRLDGVGTVESLEKITQDDIRQIAEKYMSADNMVITIFGDFKSEEFQQKITEDLNRIKTAVISLDTFQVDEIQAEVKEEQRLDKEGAMVMLGFHGPTIYAEDRDAVEVMTNILGSSFSGRLFINIREKLGNAYSLGGYESPGLDTGSITFYVLTTPEEAENVVELVKNEIRQLQTDLVSGEELTDAKVYLKGNDKIGRQTIASLSFVMALDELYGLGYQNYQKYDEKIDAVTSEQIQALAKKYLNLNKVVIVTSLPEVDTEDITE